MDLLTRQEADVLDLLCNILFDYQPFSASAFYNHPLCIEMQYDSVAEACRSLEDKKYIRSLEIDSCNTVRSLAVTYKGRNYKEYQHLEKKERWKERGWGFLSGVILASVPWLLALLIG